MGGCWDLVTGLLVQLWCRGERVVAPRSVKVPVKELLGTSVSPSPRGLGATISGLLWQFLWGEAGVR